jgi:hypothetical protein
LAFHEASLMELLSKRDLIDDPSQVTEEDKSKEKDSTPEAARQKDQDRWLSVHGQGKAQLSEWPSFQPALMNSPNSVLGPRPARSFPGDRGTTDPSANGSHA